MTVNPKMGSGRLRCHVAWCRCNWNVSSAPYVELGSWRMAKYSRQRPGSRLVVWAGDSQRPCVSILPMFSPVSIPFHERRSKVGPCVSQIRRAT